MKFSAKEGTFWQMNSHNLGKSSTAAIISADDYSLFSIKGFINVPSNILPIAVELFTWQKQGMAVSLNSDTFLYN